MIPDKTLPDLKDWRPSNWKRDVLDHYFHERWGAIEIGATKILESPELIEEIKKRCNLVELDKIQSPPIMHPDEYDKLWQMGLNSAIVEIQKAMIKDGFRRVRL